MVERFNHTLLNMLGTLEEHQKDDTKSYVAPLTHAYNAAKHDSTGFSPFFLMFGRHPRLAVDAYLGLNSQEQSISSKEHYVTKLKKRLQFAYKVASNEAEKSAERHKVNYDAKVRESTLDIGDRVLIRKVGIKGKHKQADRWDKHPYVVIDKPFENIPVFKVQKESGDKQVKILHRNMLLAFSCIQHRSDVKNLPPSGENRKGKRKKKVKQVIPVSDESSDSESSDQIIVVPGKDIKQHRAAPDNLSSVDKSKEWTAITIPDTPVQFDSRNTEVEPGSVEFSRNNTEQTETNFTNAGMPDSVPSVSNLSPEQMHPRRTGRQRRAPNRYGEWVSNPQTVLDHTQDEIIYWV